MIGRIGAVVSAPVLSRSADAQDVAVKTNVPGDALLSVSAGAKIGLAPRWTLNIEGEFNAWTLHHARRRKHWAVPPEARWYSADPGKVEAAVGRTEILALTDNDLELDRKEGHVG